MELAASLLHKAWIGYVQVVNQAQEQVIRFSSRDNLNNMNFNLMIAHR
jgi:hypothetical protein